MMITERHPPPPPMTSLVGRPAAQVTSYDFHYSVVLRVAIDYHYCNLYYVPWHTTIVICLAYGFTVYIRH